MEPLAFILLFAGVAMLLLWQDMNNDAAREADKQQIAKLIDQRNDLNDDKCDLQDEVYSLREEVIDLEEAEHDIEIDFAWEEDDD